MHKMNTDNESLLGSSLLEICINSPYCEGISKDGQNSFFKYENILFERFLNDTDWTTFLPLNLVLLKNKRRSGFNCCDFNKNHFSLHYCRHWSMLSTDRGSKEFKDRQKRSHRPGLSYSTFIIMIKITIIVDLPWRVQRYNWIFYCWIHHEKEARHPSKLYLFPCRRWT